MGRINLTPHRVRRRALAILESRRTSVRPVWLDVVGDIPPAQIFIRTQPQQHPLTKIRTKSRPPPPYAPPLPEGEKPETRVEVEVVKPKHTKKKASQLFQPVQIRYEEDELRKQFFSDHPWELARPRIVLETDGRDSSRVDWSKGIQQPLRKVDGEAVVQRQLHLLQTTPDITVSEAYDKARREFYAVRRRDEILRRVAAEEAQSTDAVFGKSLNQIGMQLENEQYNDWEEWSRKMVVEQAQRTAAFAGETVDIIDDMLDVAATKDARPGASLFAQEQRKQTPRGQQVIE